MKPRIGGKQLLSSVFLLITLSYCGAKTDEIESEVRRLEMDIPSLYLINGMFLSADQVAFLIGRQDGKKDNWNQIEQIKKNISVVRSRAMEVFDKMDKMKDAEFTANSRNLCAQFIESCLSIGAIDRNDIDKDAEIIRAEQTLTRARRMSRSEYNKTRDDLIAEICPRRNKPRPEIFGWQKSMGDQLETVNPSTQFLLSQTGLTLLEKKIKIGN